MLKALVEQLHSQDFEEREQAAQQLGNSHDPEGFKPLSEALYDPSMKVRKAAVKALGELGDLRAIELLVEFSKNENLATFEEDIQLSPSPIETALLRFGTRAVDTLLTSVKNNDNFVIALLGEIGDVRAFEPIMEVLQYSDDKYSRQTAIAALGNLGDIRALDTLISLTHSSQSDKVSAISALGRLGDPRAIDALSDFLFISAPHPHYVDSSAHFHYASLAAYSLKQIGDERALFVLMNHAQTRNALYRTLTFSELVDVDDPRVETLFSEAIHDPDDDTGWYFAIQYFRKKGGKELLIELQKSVPPRPAQAISKHVHG